MEQMLRQIIEAISDTFGNSFLNAITMQLHKHIEADHTFIARIDLQNETAQTVSFVSKGELVENIVYPLKGTPCAETICGTICCYSENAIAAFPEDQMLVDLNIESYIGMPLRDSKENLIGILVALFERPITDISLKQTLFELIALRVSNEMSRMEYERKLEALNATLEEKVAQRTLELELSIDKLKGMQEQLIESEKMASLGNLVAGLAHEVNTPLGIAVTAQSTLEQEFEHLKSSMKNNKLSKKQLNYFLQIMEELLPLMANNLRRSCDLIDDFKRTSVDLNTLEFYDISLMDYFSTILSTLSPAIKKQNVTVNLSAPNSIVTTCPGIHSQIITNLVSNSLHHAFENHGDPTIDIDINEDELGNCTVLYRDNGKGLDDISHKKIFEPFYTTARAEGGTGLGMAIVYNLVKQSLKGSIQLLDDQSGFGLEYQFSTIQHAQMPS